jgi:hypothetical protein
VISYGQAKAYGRGKLKQVFYNTQLDNFKKINALVHKLSLTHNFLSEQHGQFKYKKFSGTLA